MDQSPFEHNMYYQTRQLWGDEADARVGLVSYLSYAEGVEGVRQKI